jgi:hypothetical protein
MRSLERPEGWGREAAASDDLVPWFRVGCPHEGVDKIDVGADEVDRAADDLQVLISELRRVRAMLARNVSVYLPSIITVM